VRTPMLALLTSLIDTPEKIVFWVVMVAGLAVLTWWLLTTRFGRNALIFIPRRRISPDLPAAILPLLLPFGIILMWVCAGLAFNGFIGLVAAKVGISNGTQAAIQYSGFMVIDVILVGVVCLLAHGLFVRGLRGFGLRRRHLWRDLWRAAATLLAVLPVVLAMVQLVAIVGQRIVGSDFKMEENEGLKDLAASSEVWVKVVIVVFAGVVVPCYEEMVFRGLLQSTMTNALGRPWLAIVATSGMFSVLHPMMHWPALFVLSVAIGYTYEKSGSLLRAIFMHGLFNMTMIAAALAGA
jgi:uncharacterized protein